MMWSTSFVGIGWCLHAAFATTAAVGVVLFVIWAIKLKPDELKKWILWLLVIGLLGALLTAPFSLMGWRGMMGGNGFDGSWRNMMNWSDETKTNGNTDQGYIRNGNFVPGRMMAPYLQQDTTTTPQTDTTTK